MRSLPGMCALRWASVCRVKVGGPGTYKRFHASNGLRRVWVEVMRVIDFGGTRGFSVCSSCFSLHRKSLAVVHFTHPAYTWSVDHTFLKKKS